MQVKISFFGIANSLLLFYNFISLKYTENVVTLPRLDKIEVSLKSETQVVKLKYTNSQYFNIMYHLPKTKNEGNRRFSVASQDKDIEKLLFTF